MSQSPSTLRVLRRCRALTRESSDEKTGIGALLLALIRDESLAAAVLSSLDVGIETLQSGALGKQVVQFAQTPVPSESVEPETCEPARLAEADDPEWLTRVIDRARLLGRKDAADDGLTSGHLLLAAVQVSDVLQRLLKVKGYSESDILNALGMNEEEEVLAVPPEAELLFRDRQRHERSTPAEPIVSAVPGDAISGSQGDPSSARSPAVSVNETISAWRVIDANLNRAREGFRVLDDYARFVLSDAALTAHLKELRHALVAAEHRLTGLHASTQQNPRAGRDTESDVGTGITVPGEASRQSLVSLRTANLRRVQEALRSLEEFGKLLSAEFAESMKQLRYRTYTLEQQLSAHQHGERCVARAGSHTGAATRLAAARLCLLLTESRCTRPWKEVLEHALHAGVEVLQLREKHLADRELLTRAKWLTRACREHGAVSIINDRADIAHAAEADGVHVGQDELTCSEVRCLLGGDAIVGVSTHAVAQARQATADGASYLGAGPVFPSSTKSFDEFPGLSYLRTVAEQETIPWFAIGGITLDNLDDVLASGARRIAVTSAVSQSPAPGEAAREFLARLPPLIG